MVAAIIFALFIHFRSRLWNSRLASGGYGIAVTSWLFAFVGGFAMAALGVLYVKYKVEGFESSEDGFWGVIAILSAFSSLGIAGVSVLLYQVVAIVSVWRATSKKHVSFFTRWGHRYLLCFNLMLGGLAASVGFSGLVGGAVLYFVAWYFWLRKRKVGQQPSTAVAIEVDESVKPSHSSNLVLEGSITLSGKECFEGEPSLSDYLKRVIPIGSVADRVHAYPDLPDVKLKRAIGARYLKDSLAKQNSLFLIDDSKKLDGKSGLLITEDFFDFMPARSDGKAFLYRFTSELFEINGRAVSRHGERYFKFTYFSEDDIEKIFSVINEFFMDRQAWWLQQAQAGDSESQFKMSSTLRDELSVMYWLRKAAEQGHVIAQGNLGATLKSDEEAFYWLSLSADQGNDNAKNRLTSPRFNRFRVDVV